MMCGYLEISDLRFDSFNRDAIKRIDSNLRIKRAYSSNVIDGAQEYLKNKPVIYCKILLIIYNVDNKFEYL